MRIQKLKPVHQKKSNELLYAEGAGDFPSELLLERSFASYFLACINTINYFYAIFQEI